MKIFVGFVESSSYSSTLTFIFIFLSLLSQNTFKEAFQIWSKLKLRIFFISKSVLRSCSTHCGIIVKPWSIEYEVVFIILVFYDRLRGNKKAQRVCSLFFALKTRTFRKDVTNTFLVVCHSHHIGLLACILLTSNLMLTQPGMTFLESHICYLDKTKRLEHNISNYDKLDQI